MTRWAARSLTAVGVTGLLVLVPAAAASAHPLGNFSVNHYNGLTVRPAGVDVLAVVDIAEIPTQQELPSIDTDANDDLSAAELAEHAAEQCAALTAAVRLDVDEAPADLVLGETSLAPAPGAAGLPTLRLTCMLSAAADLSVAATVTFADDYRGDRVGWHEITARADGVRIVESPVPAQSVSDELRVYPEDLLSSPLDDRAVTLRVEPGAGESAAGPGSTGKSQDPFTRLVAWGDRELQRAVAGDLTLPVAGVAVLLALLLGAGHALLPGHGKTVMAAYLAGRRGSRRDAFLVGATVTGTHTASVLVLGLVINVSAAIVGEQALRYLGVVSGLIIAAVGAMLLWAALRSRSALEQVDGASHSHGWLGHSHSHSHSHSPGHSSHADPHGEELAPSDRHPHAGELAHSHRHPHGEELAHSHPSNSHSHSNGEEAADSNTHGHPKPERPGGRAGLMGMGVAGGLVPSPGALVVLLGSVELHRPVLGVLLVLLYGLGMAATLTAVGLLLVSARGRLDRFDRSGRLGAGGSRLVAALPLVTAALVLVVGLGLVVRAVVTLG